MTSSPGVAHQSAARTVLRLVGLVSMFVALALIATALVDFFRSMDTMEGPSRFWMFFLALPFFAVGGVCLQAGFLGAAARFGAGETMPVLRDSAAYLSGGRVTAPAGPYCRSCGTRNDETARFCDSCGSSLA